MKKCIIVANGSPPRRSDIAYLKIRCYKTLLAADGGANSLYDMNIVPDFIVGDMDSISDEALSKFKKSSEIIHIKRQTDTDVEKCLKFAIKKKFTHAVLLGATGNRLDHSFCNLGIVLKYYDKIHVAIIHERSYLAAYSGKVELKTSPGEIISIYGFDEKTKVTSKGLKYQLPNVSLPFGMKESTSNVATGDTVELKITGGKMFVIRSIEAVKANDYI